MKLADACNTHRMHLYLYKLKLQNNISFTVEYLITILPESRDKEMEIRKGLANQFMDVKSFKRWSI